MRKILIFIFVILLIILIVMYFVIGNYFYNIALNPKTDKSVVTGNLEPTDAIKEWIKKQMVWMDENSKDVYINSTNNGIIKLHGYEIENAKKSDTWVIVIHGYMSNASEMAGYAGNFNKRGYNVLMPDLRGHGKSEGDYVGMGWHDRFDIIDWINYIIEKNPNNKIILFGVSMGATTTMMTTGENLPNNVKLAISDCGYTSVWDEFSYQLKSIFNLPEFPVLYAANSSCKIKAKYDFKEASALEQVKKSKTPTLFIHGDSDSFVPFKMLDTLYNAASCEKEKLVVSGAGHGMSSTVEPDLYWKTVENFIAKWL